MPSSAIHLETTTNHYTVKEPRSVILAVISAKNDLANQLVLNLAKVADPSGNRTMGELTVLYLRHQ